MANVVATPATEIAEQRAFSIEKYLNLNLYVYFNISLIYITDIKEKKIFIYCGLCPDKIKDNFNELKVTETLTTYFAFGFIFLT